MLPELIHSLSAGGYKPMQEASIVPSFEPYERSREDIGSQRKGDRSDSVHVPTIHNGKRRAIASPCYVHGGISGDDTKN